MTALSSRVPQRRLLAASPPADQQGARRPLELYPTPLALCLAQLRELHRLGEIQSGMKLVEPHIGTCNWGVALGHLVVEAGLELTLHVGDLNAEVDGWNVARRLPFRFPGLHVEFLPAADWLELTAELASDEPIWDLAIGNPPFAIVEDGKTRGTVVCHEHIRASLRVARAACFIFRSGLVTSSTDPDRVRWATTEPPELSWPQLPRPSFTGDDKRGQFDVSTGFWRQGGLAAGEWTRSRVMHWPVEGALR